MCSLPDFALQALHAYSWMRSIRLTERFLRRYWSWLSIKSSSMGKSSSLVSSDRFAWPYLNDQMFQGSKSEVCLMAISLNFVMMSNKDTDCPTTATPWCSLSLVLVGVLLRSPLVRVDQGYVLSGLRASACIRLSLSLLLMPFSYSFLPSSFCSFVLISPHWAQERERERERSKYVPCYVSNRWS